MEKFSEQLKQDFELEKEHFSRVEERLTKLIAMRLEKSDGFALSPASPFPAKIEILMQVGLRRTIDLTEATICEANRLKIVTATVLTRAAFETACLLFDVSHKVENVVEQDNVSALAEVDVYITNTLLGHGPKAKTFILAEEFIVQNILTIIQRLSKQHGIPLEGFYEGLCEYAHPNYLGMTNVYTEPQHPGGITTFTDGRHIRSRSFAFIWLPSLSTALELLRNALVRWNEHVDGLAVLAERRLYEEGKWPADMEFPIRRT